MTKQNDPRKHHYVPEFYLRNFAADPEQLKIATLKKENRYAIWKVRSIESVAMEEHFYVHRRDGERVSVERDIGREVENPITKSKTWAKISEGRTEALDASDRGVLYGLMMNIQMRTPHHLQTMTELTALSARGGSNMHFADLERTMYGGFRADPDAGKRFFDEVATLHPWNDYEPGGAQISIYRSRIPLRTCSAPVMAIPAPPDPRLHKPSPEDAPTANVMALNRFTIMLMARGDFGGQFSNFEVGNDVALGFNWRYINWFNKFPAIEYLMCDREDLAVDVPKIGYEHHREADDYVTYRRTSPD